MVLSPRDKEVKADDKEKVQYEEARAQVPEQVLSNEDDELDARLKTLYERRSKRAELTRERLRREANAKVMVEKVEPVQRIIDHVNEVTEQTLRGEIRS